MTGTNEVEVFLCEDIDQAEDYQRELDAHAEGRPRLRIVDQARTLDDAKDHLFERERFPDLVLIDDRLGRGADATPRPSAVELMAYIWERRWRDGVETRTRCVLFTSSDDPHLFWAFRVAGGRHVVSKSLAPWPKRMCLLHAVLSGAEWWPPHPTVHLQPSLREVLPYFDAGWSRADIADHLGVGVKTITTRMSELRKAFQDQLKRAHVPAGEVALAALARETGWVWVRPGDEHLLPTGAPLPRVLDPNQIPKRGSQRD
jgi:DNA-binding NarL/FixJ family response regulator